MARLVQALDFIEEETEVGRRPEVSSGRATGQWPFLLPHFILWPQSNDFRSGSEAPPRDRRGTGCLGATAVKKAEPWSSTT